MGLGSCFLLINLQAHPSASFMNGSHSLLEYVMCISQMALGGVPACHFWHKEAHLSQSVDNRKNREQQKMKKGEGGSFCVAEGGGGFKRGKV